MLPGFRFLFAAIVLSVSTLVFGLGAAALLRASHERFASLPVLPFAPALPPAATANAASHDAAPPTLALLRVDTPGIDATTAPRATPLPVTDHTAPAPEAKDAVAAPPLLSASEPKAAPTKDASVAPVAHDPIQPPAAAELAKAAVIEASSSDAGPSPAAASAATTADTPAAQASTPDNDKTEVAAALAAPAQTEPMKVEAAKAEPSAPRIPEVALANEPRPAPLEPADAPIKTAMLAPTEPAPSTIGDPVVAIAGPIPLPRSREWALAQGHAAQRAANARKLAAIRARPRAIVRQARPAAQAPASAPNPLFPFGQ